MIGSRLLAGAGIRVVREVVVEDGAAGTEAEGAVRTKAVVVTQMRRGREAMTRRWLGWERASRRGGLYLNIIHVHYIIHAPACKHIQPADDDMRRLMPETSPNVSLVLLVTCMMWFSRSDGDRCMST